MGHSHNAPQPSHQISLVLTDSCMKGVWGGGTSLTTRRPTVSVLLLLLYLYSLPSQRFCEDSLKVTV